MKKVIHKSPTQTVYDDGTSDRHAVEFADLVEKTLLKPKVEAPEIKIPDWAINKQGKTIRVDADNGHWYRGNKEGTWKKSLTFILGAGMPLAAGLKEFFQTNTKEEADRKLKEAGLSGSKIHHTIHLMNMGKSVRSDGFTTDNIRFLGLSDKKLIKFLKAPFTKEEDKKMKGYLQFVADFKPEMIEHERILISEKLDFGCTLDAYCKITIPNIKKSYKEFAGKTVKAFIDYKSGKGIYYKDEIQVTMCGVVYREVVKKTRGDIHALLHLGANKCGYSFKIVKDPAKKRDDFDIVRKASELEGGGDRIPKFYEFEESYKLIK